MATSQFDRILSDPKVLGGKPCIKGTRISVEFLLELFASGATRESIVKEYPQLKSEDIEQALQFAASVLRNEEVIVTRIAG